MTNDDFRHDEELGKAISKQIGIYTALFQQQVERAGGWPAKFIFPDPANDIEREALRLFVEEVKKTTGAPIKVTHK